MISSIQNLLFPSTLTTLSNKTIQQNPNSNLSSISTLQKAPSTYTKHKSLISLDISKQNKEAIQNLLKELATSSIFHLACNGFKLMRIGVALRKDVHPYRFYAEILSNPMSMGYFHKIHDEKNQILSGRAQIWSDFCSNAGTTFQEYSEEIDCYTLSFADQFELDPLKIKSFQNKLDWEGLLSYFINKK